MAPRIVNYHLEHHGANHPIAEVITNKLFVKPGRGLRDADIDLNKIVGSCATIVGCQTVYEALRHFSSFSQCAHIPFEARDILTNWSIQLAKLNL